MRFATIGLMVLATACAADVDGGGVDPAGPVPTGKQDGAENVTTIRTIPGLFTEYSVTFEGTAARTAVVLEGAMAEPFLAVNGAAGDAAAAQIFCDTAEASCTLWDVIVNAEFEGDKYWYASQSGQLFTVMFDTRADGKTPNGLFDAVSLMQTLELGTAETRTHLRGRRNFGPEGTIFCGASTQNQTRTGAEGASFGEVPVNAVRCGAYGEIHPHLPRPTRSALSLAVALEDDVVRTGKNEAITVPVTGALADQLRELAASAPAPMAFVSCDANGCAFEETGVSTTLFGERTPVTFTGSMAAGEIGDLVVNHPDVERADNTNTYRWGNFQCNEPGDFAGGRFGSCSIVEAP